VGNSIPHRAIFFEMDRHEVLWVDAEDPAPTRVNAQWSDITHRAKKRLEGAEPGDEIEIVLNYDASSYPIVEAKRITGSAEEGVRLLTERVAALEGILKDLPTIIRAAADEVRGERYEDTKRVHHAVAMKVETRVKKVLGE
jgi:hypothetical protein